MRNSNNNNNDTNNNNNKHKQPHHSSGRCDIEARSLLPTTGNGQRGTIQRSRDMQCTTTTKTTTRTSQEQQHEEQRGLQHGCGCPLFTSSGWRPIPKRSMLSCEAFQEFDSFDPRRGKNRRCSTWHCLAKPEEMSSRSGHKRD